MRLLGHAGLYLVWVLGWQFKRGDRAQDTGDERWTRKAVRQGRAEMWRTQDIKGDWKSKGQKWNENRITDAPEARGELSNASNAAVRSKDRT